MEKIKSTIRSYYVSSMLVILITCCCILYFYYRETRIRKTNGYLGEEKGSFV